MGDFVYLIKVFTRYGKSEMEVDRGVNAEHSTDKGMAEGVANL